MQEIIDKYLKGDKTIWTVVILLTLASTVIALSASSNMAYRLTEGNATPFWFKHVATLVVGFVVMIYLQHFKFKYFSRISQMGIWVAGILLLMTLLFGRNINSAQRWIMGFQPSDLAKIVLILYLARLLVIKHDKLHDFKEGVLPLMIPIAGICVLILPADFSTAFMLGLASFILLFVGGVQIKHLLAVVGGAIVLFMFLLMVNHFTGILPRATTWETRLVSFFGGEAEEEDEKTKIDNYQAMQAVTAVVNGGLIGKGPGRGNVKNDTYSAQSDFVFATIIEEFGSLIGAFILLILYLTFFFRSIRVALKAQSSFGAYVAFGLSFLLVLQAMINMGVGVNLLPVTGQPLPLISMGGTSILFTCVSIGILLNVSKSVESNEKQIA
ncbi:FtsW/RodA/SpoVE family cell cycle protein [Parvicella tangerina]|uniref:Probable peptidoglycan glycosyltransferase FtsW n=1 Tax=Parvicella tangerina TaxID=2829795 RepID=A0A916NTD2_9FLAO|nr:FtsW/RodA/SpoVE family cell cycle protein [Parvicella tangerina]CAG5085692.1 putative peptidoglycan glycosyltransferase FtsW [Parvicella tangerina]